MLLFHYLNTSTIRLRVAVPDWEAAVRTAGGLLVDTEICTTAYVEAMIEAVHVLGPYMVLAPGLALAHARPESGALAMGLSLVTLEPPVAFGSADNDPVHLVCAFATLDNDSHIDMLAAIARLLSDGPSRERIGAAHTPQEVLQVIRDYANRQD